MTDTTEMLAELDTLNADVRATYLAYAKAKDAFDKHCAKLGPALIAEGGWKEGDEIKLKDGTLAWISWLMFDPRTVAVRAKCYRMLKSGKRSKSPDITVTLKQYEKS
jgi:hypothetical protein